MHLLLMLWGTIWEKFQLGMIMNGVFPFDSILDKQGESFENKEKAKMILAQIHDKLGAKL